MATPLLGADVLALFDGHPEARATHERAAAFHAVGNARESLPLLTRLQSDEPRPWDQLTGILLVDGLAQVNSLVEATSRLAAYRARWGVDSYPVCQALIEARLERRRGLQKQQASRSDAVGLEDYRSALGHLAGPLDDPLCGPDALYLRGILERTVGDRTAAYRTLEQMAERFPDAPRSPHALRVAAEEARRMADVSGARALLERHVENYPDHAATRAVRSQLRELGRWNETAPEVRIEKWITPGTLPGAADAKGHLLVFFATWCPRCQSEADEVEALHARYVGQGLEVVALTRHTRGQDDAAVEDFVTEHSLTHPVAIDAGGTQESYGIRRLPTAVWVAADGRAVWRGAPSELLPEVAARLLSNVN